MYSTETKEKEYSTSGILTRLQKPSPKLLRVQKNANNRTSSGNTTTAHVHNPSAPQSHLLTTLQNKKLSSPKLPGNEGRLIWLPPNSTKPQPAQSLRATTITTPDNHQQFSQTTQPKRFSHIPYSHPHLFSASTSPKAHCTETATPKPVVTPTKRESSNLAI